MIEYKKMDITGVDNGVIIHGVNCLRVMGSGVALAIKNKWPQIFEIYKKMPSGKQMLGQTHFICVQPGLYVGNCYTQLNFGRDNKRYADIDAVKSCLKASFSFADLNQLDLYSPMIASGLGGLDWESEVQPIFEELNTKYEDLNVTICYI